MDLRNTIDAPGSNDQGGLGNSATVKRRGASGDSGGAESAVESLSGVRRNLLAQPMGIRG